MGLFGLFKRKKEEEAPSMEVSDIGTHETDPLGLPKDRDMGELPDIEPLPMTENPQPSFRSTQGNGMPDSKDVQIIISKLDLINARLENLNERLMSLERTYINQERRRW